jgi:hypothetical protein
MKLSVLGLWRDSESIINRTLSTLDNISKENNTSFYFYENDSIDNTKESLQKWIDTKNGFLLSENIKAPKFGSVPDIQRLILLSYYRNKAKTLLLNSDSEYTLLIDTDINFDINHLNILYESIIRLNCAMVIANTRQHQIADLMNNQTIDSFYDVFALRDVFNNNGLYFTDCPFILNHNREAWINNQPIRILSGFSGFALIRTDILKQQNCFWSTCGHSEHVNFCYNINRYGEIFIIPECKPTTDINLSSINLEACKNIAINQKEKINQINHIFNLSISTKLI